jgi:hypothetical protein
MAGRLLNVRMLMKKRRPVAEERSNDQRRDTDVDRPQQPKQKSRATLLARPMIPINRTFVFRFRPHVFPSRESFAQFHPNA